MPQYAAGRIIEPPVWLPNAIGTMPAATAAAEPDDEPPGVCAGLCGLRVPAGCKPANSVGLAEDDAAGTQHQRDHGRVGFRLMPGIDRRAVGGREIDGVENIFHADRQSAQRRAREARRLRAALRRGQIKRGEGADFRLARRDRLGAEFDDRRWRKLPAFDPAREIEGGKHQAVPLNVMVASPPLSSSS
jgi:hypothetical protein